MKGIVWAGATWGEFVVLAAHASSHFVVVRRGQAIVLSDSASLGGVQDALFQPFPMPTAARAHIWRYAPQNRRPRHFHSEPELNLVAAGTGAFGMGEAVLRVGAGDLLCWPPGQDHVLLEASPDFDLFVIGLTPALSARVLAETHASPFDGSPRLNLPSAALAKLCAMCAVPMENQDAAVIEHRVGELWREAHTLRVIGLDSHTSSSQPAAVERHVFTRRTLASLIDRPDLGRDDVALLARGYPTEVSRHFHRDMGLTLTEYRTRLRLLRFIQFADGGHNMLSAALESGFGSYSQCHRAFQRTFGCTPRHFFGTDVRQRMGDVFSPWA